jgi:hypothetical protein
MVKTTVIHYLAGSTVPSAAVAASVLANIERMMRKGRLEKLIHAKRQGMPEAIETWTLLS